MSGLFARIFHRTVGGVLPGQAALFRRRQPPPQNAARPQNNKIPQGKTANRAQKNFARILFKRLTSKKKYGIIFTVFEKQSSAVKKL